MAGISLYSKKVVWDVVRRRSARMNFGFMALGSKEHFVFSEKRPWIIRVLWRQLVFSSGFMAAASKCTVTGGLSSVQVWGVIWAFFLIPVIPEDRCHVSATQISLSDVVGRTSTTEQWTDPLFLEFMDP